MALINLKTMFWVKKTEFPRPRSGLPENAEYLPGTIKALARDWASKKTSTAHGNGGSMVRGPFSTEPARLEVLLLAMQGIGKPGRHQVKMIEWGLFGDPGQYPMPNAIALPDVMAAAQGQRGSAVQSYGKRVTAW